MRVRARAVDARGVSVRSRGGRRRAAAAHVARAAERFYYIAFELQPDVAARARYAGRCALSGRRLDQSSAAHVRGVAHYYSIHG